MSGRSTKAAGPQVRACCLPQSLRVEWWEQGVSSKSHKEQAVIVGTAKFCGQARELEVRLMSVRAPLQR